jgi:hypothetical protein
VNKGKQLTGEIGGDRNILTGDEVLRILSEMAQIARPVGPGLGPTRRNRLIAGDS